MWLVVVYGLSVGVALGLSGGGGSIFAVPLLLYAVGLPLREAVTVSLLVVGLTSALGAFLQRRLVQWRAGFVLGVGGVLGAPLGAWIGSMMPERLTMLSFAALMIFVGVRMLRGNDADAGLPGISCRRDSDGMVHFHWPCAGRLFFAGGLVGVMAGIFGVGGGFLVVTALVMVLGMPVNRALATSLVGIGLISAAAFASNYAKSGVFPVEPALGFLAGSAIGMLAGILFKSRLSEVVLKRIIGTAMVLVAVWIMFR